MRNSLQDDSLQEVLYMLFIYFSHSLFLSLVDLNYPFNVFSCLHGLNERIHKHLFFYFYYIFAFFFFSFLFFIFIFYSILFYFIYVLYCFVKRRENLKLGFAVISIYIILALVQFLWHSF